ncbi:MAG: helix-turn-helix transcriptional regulator [Clostridia bacterium]|nr:helix-turn-helix transcriptional regulator [Clostridia bacterium]
MSIKCNLSTLMGKHKMTIQDVCNKTGLARNTVSFLYHEKQTAINFETLNKLCELFNCNTQDILVYNDDNISNEVKN